VSSCAKMESKELNLNEDYGGGPFEYRNIYISIKFSRQVFSPFPKSSIFSQKPSSSTFEISLFVCFGVRFLCVFWWSWDV
jgi:hypothetical protein